MKLGSSGAQKAGAKNIDMLTVGVFLLMQVIDCIFEVVVAE